jgi:hypothetical protein
VLFEASMNSFRKGHLKQLVRPSNRQHLNLAQSILDTKFPQELHKLILKQVGLWVSDN